MLCVTRRNSTSQSPTLNALSRLNSDQPIAGIDAVLFELRPHERQRQRRAIDRPVDERPHVRHAADMILMTVRQQQRGRTRLALLQIRVRSGISKIDAG